MTSKRGATKETPSQTAGPYVHIGLAPDHAGLGHRLPPLRSTSHQRPTGTPLHVTGRVIDGAGDPVTDALIEIWHADADGVYSQNAGWARVVPDFETGVFAFEIIKPGAIAMAGAVQMAPHVNLWLVARGINIGLQTRMYFPEDAALFEADPVLSRIADPQRRATLISRKDRLTHHFDIVLQGADETVFFDV